MNNQSNSGVSAQLGSAPVGRLLLKLAAPAVVAQLVNLLYNIVDRIYIGHMPEVGTAALTGIGLCFPVVYLIGAFTMLVAQGGAPRAAIAMGAGDNEQAEKIMGGCFTCLVGTALVLTALFWAFGEPLLWLFGCSEDTIQYALPYMRIYSSGSLFVMMALGMNLFVTTQGFATVSMRTVIIGAVSNIILDPIFIYGLHMGVQGAALATVISQAVSGIWVVYFLMGKKTTLRLRRKCLRPSWKLMAPVLALGISPFVMQSTEALVNISFNSSLQQYGGDIAVGAMVVASTVMQMVWIPAQGLGQGAQPIISYNYGARNAKRVKEAFFALLKVSCAFLASFWLLVQLFPGFFISIFNDNAALMETAVWTLRVYTAVLGLFGIQMSVQQTFMAIGKAKASLFIACLRKVILLIPLIFLLPRLIENKVLAVFLAEPVSDFISVTASAVTFYFVFRPAMRELEKGTAEE
ncbi:MAG: MATE family efflux transporter [Oscillospiraceae bacterium]|nr:MATE family efflux transporter [Oscillospiraceae bacterium]